MKTITVRIFTLAGICGLAVSASMPAWAQSRAAAKPPTQITVTNARAEALQTLVVQTTGENPRVVGNIAKGLAPGKTQKLALKRPQGCSYNVLASFADGTEAEAEGLDLCRDKVIRLTE